MAVTSFPFHSAAAQAFRGNIAWTSARTTSADGHTTSGSTTVTSATADFTHADVGASISGTGLPGGETITAVTNATTATISTSTGVTTQTTSTFTITPVNDTIKMALFTAAPSLTAALYTDLSNEVAAGGGYSTGGTALTSLTAVTTEAASWGTAWAATTAHSVGDIIRPATAPSPDFLVVCVASSGNTGGSEPTWSNIAVPGQTLTDGSVTWSNIGAEVTVFSSAAASWSSSTITASYAVIYDAATNDGVNIVQINFGGSQSDTSGTFTVSPPASPYGWFWIAGN